MEALLQDLAARAQFTRPRLRRAEASQYLLEVWGLSFKQQTLAKMACIGGGPPFHKVGAQPLYPTDGLDRWAEQKLGPLKTSTSA